MFCSVVTLFTHQQCLRVPVSTASSTAAVLGSLDGAIPTHISSNSYAGLLKISGKEVGQYQLRLIQVCGFSEHAQKEQYGSHISFALY